MKRFNVVFLLSIALCALLPSLLHGQWLETTIYLPDSLCGVLQPQAFTYNTTNNKIYVGGEEGNCVIVIDGASNQKIARIPAGSNIRALCWNSTNNKVYCANYWSNNVTVIDGATNAVITTIAVGINPYALVWNSQNNKVYCANGGSNNVTVIDGATNAVITTITVGSIPWALVWNSQNNKVYCANTGSNNVTVIDGTTNAVITTITVGSRPWALVWNSQNNKVYCANYWSNNVTVIDGTTNAVITTIPVGTYPCALVWNSQNNKVYCANDSTNNVTVIDGTTNAVITTVPVGYAPYALVWNSFNNKVYCANRSSENVSVISGATNAVITTIAVGDGPWAFCWNSIQNRVYVANYYSSSVSVIRDSDVSHPHISVSPMSFSLSLQQSQTKDTILTIGNTGNANLNWSLTEVPSVTWLSESPTSGTIIPTGQTNVTVSFNTSGLSPATYRCTLRITSNDSVNPTINVPITLTVTSVPQPQISVNPTSFNLSLQQGQTKDTIMRISNTGNANLNWGLTKVPSVAWLSENPTSGTIIPTGQTNVTVSFNTAGLSPATYRCTLRITSNDPTYPTKSVPVNLSIVTQRPIIELDTVKNLIAGRRLTISGRLRWPNGNPYIPTNNLIGIDDPIACVCYLRPVDNQGKFTHLTNTTPTKAKNYSFGIIVGYLDTFLYKYYVIPLHPATPEIPLYTSASKMYVGGLDINERLDKKTATLTKKFSYAIQHFDLFDVVKSFGNEMWSLSKTYGVGLWNRWGVPIIVAADRGSVTDMFVTQVKVGKNIAFYGLDLPLNIVLDLTQVTANKIIDEIPNSVIPNNEKQMWKDVWIPTATTIGSAFAVGKDGELIDYVDALNSLIENGIQLIQVTGKIYKHNPKNKSDSTLAGFSIIAVDSAGNYFCYGVAPIDTNAMLIRTTCPVDIIVTDQQGKIVCKDSITIPDAWYREIDINSDGSLDDEVIILSPLLGEYNIQVVPETKANPTDSFSLYVYYALSESAFVLAKNVMIESIPSQPFTFTPYGNQAPNPFTLMYPPNEYFYADLPMVLVWNSTTDPNPGQSVFYDIILSSDSSFIDTSVVYWVSGTSYLISSLSMIPSGCWTGSDTGKCYWKVRAHDSWNGETYSDDYRMFKFLSQSKWEAKRALPSGLKNVKQGGAGVFVDSLIFAFKGNNTQEFYAYDITNDTWVTKCTIPKGINNKRVKAGASLCYDGLHSIYALKGGNTLEFWEYDIDNNTWTRKRDVPLGANKKIKGGSGLVFAPKGDSSFVFCLKASNTQEFYAYYLQGDTWLKRKDAPLGLSGKGFDKGSCITYNGNDTIFALKGSYNEFYAYSIARDTWITRQPMPMNSIYGRNKKAKDGASITYRPEGIIYGIKGGNTQEFWAYDVNANNWSVKETIPKGPSKKRIGAGGSLCYAMGHIYALKGNNTLEFWRYTPGGELTGKTVSGIMSQPTKMIYPFMLYQNEPNPFKPVTAIRYSLPAKGKVCLQIYDVSGRLVKSLVNEVMSPGVYTVNWNGTDDNGRRVSQGIYFYVLKTDNNKMQKKMLMLK